MSTGELVKRLRSEKFSITIDESTDRGCVKHLAVVVRHLTPKFNKVVDEFLALIPVSCIEVILVVSLLFNEFVFKLLFIF